MLLSIGYAISWNSIDISDYSMFEERVEFTIADKSWNSNIFKFEYKVHWQNKSWEMTTDQSLPAYYTVVFPAQNISIQSYDRSQPYEAYKRSQGVFGSLSLSDYSIISTRCSALCSLSILQRDLNNANSRAILDSVCSRWKTVVNYLYIVGPCTDIAIFINGLVVNVDESGLSDDFENIMQSASLSHVISVSGFQITVLALFLEIIINKIYLPTKPRLFVVTGILMLYSLFAGINPPIIRALISSIVSMAALTFLGRKLPFVSSLIYSAIILLVVFPSYLYSYSFMLSFAATLGVSLLPLQSTSDLKHVFWYSSLATILAFFATLPISSQFESSINPLSLLIGSLILPITPIITILATLSMIPIIGEISLLISSVVLSLYFSSLHMISRFGLLIRFEAFTFTNTVIYYALFLGTVFWIRKFGFKQIRFRWKEPNHNIKPYESHPDHNISNIDVAVDERNIIGNRVK